MDTSSTTAALLGKAELCTMLNLSERGIETMVKSGRFHDNLLSNIGRLSVRLRTDATRPTAVVGCMGKWTLNVQAQGRGAGLPAARPSGAHC